MAGQLHVWDGIATEVVRKSIFYTSAVRYGELELREIVHPSPHSPTELFLSMQELDGFAVTHDHAFAS
jgi:hypothetical protein